MHTKFVLYDAANSPCGRRVRMTLLEKKCDFEICWLNLGFMEQKQDWYLKLNPAGLVPTLVHGKRAVFDANVICEYLDHVIPEPSLIPKSKELQVEMRMWMAYEMEWAKPFREAIYQTYGKTRLQSTRITETALAEKIVSNTQNPAYARFAQRVLTEPADEQRLSEYIGILFERMSWMEERLSDNRPWLLGDDFSLADITLAPRLDMFPFIGVDDLFERYPNIGKFMQRVCERESWQASALLPEPDKKKMRVSASG